MSIVNIDINSVNTDAQYAVGQIFRDDVNHKTYKYVKYNDGTENLDLVAGDVVTYVDDSGYAAATVTADDSDATGKNMGAGVAVTTVTVDASYFWIQIKGGVILTQAIAGSGNDGDLLTAEAGGNKALTLAKEADTGADYVHVCAITVDITGKEIICAFPE